MQKPCQLTLFFPITCLRIDVMMKVTETLGTNQVINYGVYKCN